MGLCFALIPPEHSGKESAFALGPGTGSMTPDDPESDRHLNSTTSMSLESDLYAEKVVTAHAGLCLANLLSLRLLLSWSQGANTPQDPT